LARCWTCSRSASACPGSSSTPVLVREARDGQRGVKAQVQPSSGSAQDTPLEEDLPVGYSRSLLRRPDPGRPSGHGEVARRNTTRDTRQVPLHHRPLAQRGGGLPSRRSRSSKGRQGSGTPRSGGGRGFRAIPRSSPSTTSSGSWWGS